MGRLTGGRLCGWSRRCSLSMPSWSAKADHPRVCLPWDAPYPARTPCRKPDVAWAATVERVMLKRKKHPPPGLQTRGWSAFADHDGLENEVCRLPLDPHSSGGAETSAGIAMLPSTHGKCDRSRRRRCAAGGETLFRLAGRGRGLCRRHLRLGHLLLWPAGPALCHSRPPGLAAAPHLRRRHAPFPAGRAGGGEPARLLSALGRTGGHPSRRAPRCLGHLRLDRRRATLAALRRHLAERRRLGDHRRGGDQRHGLTLVRAPAPGGALPRL